MTKIAPALPSYFFEIKLANLRIISYLCPVIAIIIEIC